MRSRTLLARVAVAVMTIGVAACSSDKTDTSSGDAGPSAKPATAVIGPSGGTFASSDGSVTLNVPAGALSAEVTFTVSRITSPPAGSFGAYEIGPSGTTFTTPATLTLRYDAASLPSGTKLEDLRLATYVGGRWQPVPAATLDGAAGTVSASIEHLSPWGAVVTGSCSQAGTSGAAGCSITCVAPEVAVCGTKADASTSGGAPATTPTCSCEPSPPSSDAGTTACTGSEISCGDHCCPGGSTCLGNGCM